MSTEAAPPRISLIRVIVLTYFFEAFKLNSRGASRLWGASDFNEVWNMMTVINFLEKKNPCDAPYEE